MEKENDSLISLLEPEVQQNSLVPSVGNEDSLTKCMNQLCRLLLKQKVKWEEKNEELKVNEAARQKNRLIRAEMSHSNDESYSGIMYVSYIEEDGEILWYSILECK